MNIGLRVLGSTRHRSSAAPIMLVAHAAATTGGSTTTTGVDTTDANFIVVAVGGFNSFTPSTSITDSNNNSWTALTAYESAEGGNICLFYCVNPTVGADHTFGTNDNAYYASIAMAAFSGVGTFESGTDYGHAQGTSELPGFPTGPVTCQNVGDLYVTACTGYINPNSVAVDSSFVQTDTVGLAPTSYCWMSLAYLIATTTDAVSPQWSVPGASDSYDCATAIAAFSAA